jgi:hypothetical protein
MSLAAGTRLGPYEIVALIGAGGMGEVYKARDTRLDRTVAIKVLPGNLSADPDRRARLEREATTIAGLTHPHICTLHALASTTAPCSSSWRRPTRRGDRTSAGAARGRRSVAGCRSRRECHGCGSVRHLGQWITGLASRYGATSSRCRLGLGRSAWKRRVGSIPDAVLRCRSSLTRWQAPRRRNPGPHGARPLAVRDRSWPADTAAPLGGGELAGLVT